MMSLNRSFRTTLRHLWHKRTFTALNVLGLAIGIASCWMIYRICSHEFAYDRDLPGVERTYRVITQLTRNGQQAYNGGVAAPLYQGVRQELTGWEQVVPVFQQWINTVQVQRADGQWFSEDDPQGVAMVDQSYFELVPYRWLQGNPETALNAPDQVVLTESQAKAYFPDLPLEAIIDQQIIYESGDTTYRRVSGIVMDLDGPTEFTDRQFLSLQDQVYGANIWTNTNGSDKLYIRLRAGAEAGAFLAQIDALDRRQWNAFEQERGSDLPKTKSYELMPLRESHFATQISDRSAPPKISKTVLYGLIGVGFFLLILACINYINMSVAQIPERAKEIGVRKTMGSGPGQLMGQFLFETLLTGTTATVLAMLLGRLGFWWLAELIPAGVTPGDDAGMFLLFALGIIVVITLLAGLYPAWLITRVKTIEVFRGSFSGNTGKNKLGLQRMLILFQFTMAATFISSTIIVGAQLRHTMKSELGFDKEAVVLVEVPFKYLYNNPAYENRQFTLLEELRNQPGVSQVSLGTPPLSSGYSSSPFAHVPVNGESLHGSAVEPPEVIMYKKTIDTTYLGLYDMALVAGRNIRPSDTLNEFIINETAVSALGFADPQEAVGKLMHQRGQQAFPIVGVVRDFHSQDFYTPITPMALMAGNHGRSIFSIKLDGNNPAGWQAAMEAVRQQWNQFYPADAYTMRFYDQTLEALYTQERKMARLINLATGITILISCLGLFGLAALATYRKTKEIGIRKVLGASVAGIVAMLSRDFVKLVLLASLIAAPIAWWAMNKWLEDFVYRIEIQWWMFALAGFSAVIIALATVSWQAVRAALANPVDSLRDE